MFPEPSTLSVREKAAAVERFELTDYDEHLVLVAKEVARLLLRDPGITAGQFVGLGHALHALERLPLATAGADMEFGAILRGGNESFSEIHYVDFWICDAEFGVSSGGGMYDAAAGSDSYSVPGWSIRVDGVRCAEFAFHELEDTIVEYLSLGAEIAAHADSVLDIG